MKKLSITLTMLNRSIFFIHGNVELWNLLKVDDEFVIMNDVAKDMFFAFQVDQIIDSTVKEIVGRYYKVSKRLVHVSERYHMFIELMEIQNPRKRKI